MRKFQKKNFIRSSFMNLKEGVSVTEVQDEAASADVEAARSYPEDLAKIINAGGYMK